MKYEYDTIGRIVKEINEPINKVYEYTYDEGGNITSKKEYNIENKVIDDNSIDYNLDLLYNYTYEYDSLYKDKLIKVNDTTYSYSNNFLLSSCDKYNYTWGSNNTLTKITLKDTLRDINYTYNAYGQRASSSSIIAPNVRKTITYIYNEGKLLQEKIQVRYIDQSPETIKPSISESYDIITYIYDESSLIGFKYNETSYFYRRDILGNIKYILNNNLDIVAKYEYDAWGNHVVYEYTIDGYVINSLSSFIGNINPIRYKGYYYDIETQLYWVSSRYYSPELCRWISPDSIEYLDPESINGLNLYAYCGNDPVNKYDPTGHFPILLAFILGGAIIGGTLGGITAYSEGQDILTGVLTGALLGASVGGIIGVGGVALSGAVSSVLSKTATDLISVAFYGGEFGSWEDYAIAFAFGGLTGSLGSVTGKFAGFAKAGKFAVDVALRPAANQLVKMGTRGNTFNYDKYLYDVITRAVTYGDSNSIMKSDMFGLNLKVDLRKCFYRSTFRSLYSYI